MRLKKSSRYLALEDAIFDSRIPLRSEEEFRVGITFLVKLVGCGNVPRPNSRMEIVASMRRIRSDCRMRKDKKRKTVLTVSYEGVKVALPSNGKKSNANLTITQHPIHRIFYVSHDSLDLHIFSYIAREGTVFKCFVFKAAKQSLAVNIVRTIGQAFELCHKMTQFIMNNQQTQQQQQNDCANSNNSSTITAATTTKIDNDINEQLNGEDIEHGSAHGQHCQPAATTCTDKARIESAPPECGLRKHLSLNMEQMIHDVDCKLDKLSDKIEILERQISVLLSIHHDHKHSSNINNDQYNHNLQTNSISRSNQKNVGFGKHRFNITAIEPSNDNHQSKSSSSNNNAGITTSPDKPDLVSFQQQKSLNSPDSLLSSPKHHHNKPLDPSDSSIHGSCLLFNDL